MTDQREPRASVIIRALITHDTGVSERRVRNLSSHGACVEADDSLRVGMKVTVSMGACPATEAEVVWVTGTLAGLRFARMVDLALARRPRTATSNAQAGWLVDLSNPYRRKV